MNSILVIALLIPPSLALNKDCLIVPKNPSKEYEVKLLPQTIPMTTFLSSSDVLKIQLPFIGLKFDSDSDYLEISSNECSVIKFRHRSSKKEQLACTNITQGWHKADIIITQSNISIGKFLNYNLDHPISHVIATADNTITCVEDSPTWNITEATPNRIPLKGLEFVNITMESDVQFSPILHIMSSFLVPLSWKKNSIATSPGPPLPKGLYYIFIHNESEQISLTVYSREFDVKASLTNLGDPLDGLGISTTKGIFLSILNFDYTQEPPELATAPIKEVLYEENSNTAAIIAYIFAPLSIILIMIIVYVYIMKSKEQTIQNMNNDLEKRPLMSSKINKTCVKVDIKKITENCSQLIDPDNKPMQKFKIMMKEDHIDKEKKVQKLSLGSLVPGVATKYILILGEIGTGKSATINTMVNHIFGIELTDIKRFLLIDNETERDNQNLKRQTEFMTAYVLPYHYGMPNNCNYVIIDTPGFGDARGFDQDKKIMLQLEYFLKQNYGISHIDVVGFVVKSTAPRLTIAQRYIYDGLFSMFGKDISHNLFLLVTFADQEVPPVLKVLEDADIHYNGYFKLNNDSLYRPYIERDTVDNDFDQPEFIKFNWEMSKESLQNIFEKLMTINPVSLSLTKVVLEENTRLRSIVSYLQTQIKEGLDKMTQLNSNRIESTEPEDTKLIEQKISHTEENLVVSIKEAQQLTERLKEIPLRLDPLSVHGYIELLISNEEKEMNSNYEERIQILEKLKEENEVLKAVINKAPLPGEGWLNYFQKLKEE